MMSYVFTLEGAADYDAELVGNKAWNLSLLLREGFPVPDGFCVTSKAFDIYAAEPAVAAVIAEAHQRLIADQSVDSARRVSRGVRQALAQTAVPAAAEVAIRQHYENLCQRQRGRRKVAVRSSAIGEDGVTTSFAGQHRTFLNVVDVESVLGSTISCWLSLWAVEAILYRIRRAISIEASRMAVIVQVMVESRFSGVVFTRDPISGDDQKFSVNIAQGAGEEIVSGRVTPVELRIPKRRRLGSLVAWWAARRQAPSLALTPRQIDTVLQLADQIERIFGTPQDVEWSFDGSITYVLQSRPVTTAGRSEVEIPQGIWTRIGLGEWLQRPVSPAFGTFILPRFSEAVDRLLTTRWGIRQRRPTWTIYNDFFYMRLGVDLDFKSLRFPRNFLDQLDTAAEEWGEHFVPEYRDELRRLSKVEIESLNPESLLRHLEDLVELAGTCWSWIVFTGINAKVSVLIFRAMAKLLPKKAVSQHLIGGSSNKSIEADQALWQLAEDARPVEALRSAILQQDVDLCHESADDGEEIRRWRQDFNKWLERYGHRVFDLDVSVPTLREQPLLALDLVRLQLRNPGASPESKRASLAVKVESAEVSLREWLRSKPASFSRVLLRSMRRAQRYHAMREDRPFYLHHAWPPIRQTFLEIGKRLERKRWVDSPADIFFLNDGQIRDAVIALQDEAEVSPFSKDSIRTSVNKFDQSGRAVPPQYLGGGGLHQYLGRLARFLRRLGGGDRFKLHGSAGSPGIATGRARIALSEVDFEFFQRDEVLVTRYTTPAWTPLLSLASAVVTEVGGSLSHAAIIAREYGIPAVVGVDNLLRSMQNGLLLEVDGDAGVVRFKTDSRQGDPSDVEKASD